VGDKFGYEAAVALGLQLAMFLWLLDSGYHRLITTVFWTLNHVAIVRSTDFSRHLLAPGVRLVVSTGTFHISGVAFRLKPGPTHSLLRCSVLFGKIITLLDERCVALLQAVVERDLLEVNLARLPEALLTLLFLRGEKLRDVGVVALRHVLVPALLHLVIFHMVHIFHLCNAPRAIRPRSSAGEVDNSGKIWIFWILEMRH
jgi:hypothetical protein